MNYWIYNGKEIKSLEDFDKEYLGFTYKIINLDNNKIYIGRKQFYSTLKKQLGKKAILSLTDKRKSKFQNVTKESNWKNYTGSNSTLNEDIKNGAKIKKEILKLCSTKSEMTYFETKYQFLESVIEKDSYNDNILGKFYRKIFD